MHSASGYAATNAFAGRRRPEESADLRQFFEILSQRWKFIAVCVAAALALALAYLAVASTAYTATVAILIDARTRAPVGNDGAAAPASTPDATLVESQVKLIASDTVLRRVAVSENLANDADYVPTKPGLRARLYPLIGLAPPLQPDDKLSRATYAFSRSVSVKRSERTYVIEVDVASGSPTKAARLANAVADSYIADQRDARALVSRRDADWLTQRIAELQTKLQEAEIRAQEYRVKYRIGDAVGKNAVEQEYADLTAELGKARARTIDAQSKYQQMQNLVASGRSPEATADAVKSPILEKLRVQSADLARQDAQLRTTLGDRHPALMEVQNQLRDVRQLIATELKRVVETASNEFQLARNAERETARRVETARQSTDVKNGSLVELRELDREVEARRGAYEKFLRARETMYDDVNDGPIARVIAPATAPLGASSPKAAAILFIALVSGLSLGVGGALLRDYAGGARAQEIAPRGAGASRLMDDEALPVIGSMPKLANQTSFKAAFRRWTNSKADASAEPQKSRLTELRDHPQSPYSEAIRELLDRLLLRDPMRGGAHRAMKILLSSQHRGRGRTTIAANLALASALAGKRTLLIDADLDNPSLRSLITPDMRPELIELSGSLRPIYNIPVEGGEFRLVPMLTNENELCRGLRQRASTPRLKGIEGRFDLVLIDGPTLQAGAQLQQVAGAVNRIVVVTGASDPAPFIDDLAEVLGVSEQKLAGAVLSMSAPGRAA